MAKETHERARRWAAAALGAADVGAGATFHLRTPEGRRIRVAGRHIEGRQPNYFALGPTLAGDPFDDLVVVLFDTDWSVEYAYRLPIAAVVHHHKQPGRQGCRLMIRGDDSWRSDRRVQRLDRPPSVPPPGLVSQPAVGASGGSASPRRWPFGSRR